MAMSWARTKAKAWTEAKFRAKVRTKARTKSWTRARATIATFNFFWVRFNCDPTNPPGFGRSDQYLAGSSFGECRLCHLMIMQLLYELGT